MVKKLSFSDAGSFFWHCSFEERGRKKRETQREREEFLKREGYLFYIRALNKVENSFVKFEN